MKTKMMLMGISGMLLVSSAFAEMQSTFYQSEISPGENNDRPSRNKDLKPTYAVEHNDPDKVTIEMHGGQTRTIDRPTKDSDDQLGAKVIDAKKLISGGENSDHSVRYVDLEDDEVNRTNPALSAIAPVEEDSSNFRAGAQDAKNLTMDQKFRRADGTWDSNYWAGYSEAVAKSGKVTAHDTDSMAGKATKGGAGGSITNMQATGNIGATLGEVVAGIDNGVTGGGETKFTDEQLAAAVAQCKAERDRHGQYLALEEGVKLTQEGKPAPTYQNAEQERLHREYLLLAEGFKVTHNGKAAPSDCSKATPDNPGYKVESVSNNPNIKKDTSVTDTETAVDTDRPLGVATGPKRSTLDGYYEFGLNTIDDVNDATRKGMGDFCLGKPMRIEDSTEGLSGDDLVKAEAYKKMYNLAKEADPAGATNGCKDTIKKIVELGKAKAAEVPAAE